METIKTSFDLRNHDRNISKQCREDKTPVMITRNGCKDTANSGLQNYHQMKSELELLITLIEAEEDVRIGRVAPMQDTFDDIKKSLLGGSCNE